MGNQKTALIISGAPAHAAFDLHPHAAAADFILCADHGYDYALAQGIVPDMFVGDGDSCQQLPQQCKTIRLPAQKDDTDTMYAVKTVLAQGYRAITLVCATGGRIDHMLCNLSLCEYVHAQGGRLEIIDARNHVQFLGAGTVQFARNPAYKYFSIMPLTGELLGVSITGAAYPLSNAKVTRTEIYTVSNECVNDFVTISIAKGCALLVHSTD